MAEKLTLKRVITLPLLILYGTGTILGAGIYALIGNIAAVSGIYTPVSFLISAFIAAFVAFTYAELSSRYPKSAGEAVYVSKAFTRRELTALVGWGIVLTGIVSSAVMARAFAGYLNELVVLPEGLSICLFVLFITFVAIVGIRLSVNIAALVTMIEIGGIFLILYVSRHQLHTLAERWPDLLPPFAWPVWRNILFGAFLAFYAYIGFEDIINVAEEVIEPESSLPKAIIISLLVATVIYILVSIAAVLTLPVSELAGHKAPFTQIFRANSEFPPEMISLISLIAILNGALVQIVMGSRVMFGMAENGVAPGMLSIIHPKTRTPVYATLVFSVLLLMMALWQPIEKLAVLTSLVILVVFALVSLGLCKILYREKNRQATFLSIPFLVSFVSFLLCLGFIVLQLN